MAKLVDAVNLLVERKYSAIGEEHVVFEDHTENSDQTCAIVDTQAVKLICIGLDLDIDEATDISVETALTAAKALAIAINKGYDYRKGLVELMSSLWVDGVITGMVLSDLQQKEEGEEEENA